MAAAKAVAADPQRLVLFGKAGPNPESFGQKRAALVATLPWTSRITQKKPEELEPRAFLGWACGYLPSEAVSCNKAIAWWVRDLSRHDPAAGEELSKPTARPSSLICDQRGGTVYARLPLEASSR